MRVVRWTSLNPEERGESKSGGGGECCPRTGNKKQPNDRKAVPKLACAVGSFKTSSPNCGSLTHHFQACYVRLSCLLHCISVTVWVLTGPKCILDCREALAQTSGAHRELQRRANIGVEQVLHISQVQLDGMETSIEQGNTPKRRHQRHQKYSNNGRQAHSP